MKQIGMCPPMADYDYYILMTTDGWGRQTPELIDIWLRAIGF